MHSARISRVSVLLFSGLVGSLIGIGCSSSDSGGTTATCGYACVESTTQKGTVSSGMTSPSSAAACQTQADDLQSKTGYAICSNDVVTTSSSGACDESGAAFIVELDYAILHCTASDPDNLPACIEDVFRNHPRWNFPEECIKCAGEKYAAFEGCILAASPLDEDSLKLCIDTWVTDSVACSP